MRQPSCMPRSASRAVASSATIVSTMPSGMAPMAARSLTLVRTAATNAGSSASPQAMTWLPSAAVSTTAPSSPGPCTQLPAPNISPTSSIPPFARSAGLVRNAPASASRSVAEPAEPATCAPCRKVNETFSIGHVGRPAFLDLPARQDKPRAAGLTHVLDNGASAVHTEGTLAAAEPYIDVWKFGWGTAYLDRALRAKLDLLALNDVLACIGGTLLEIAWAREVGFGAVEVSRGIAAMTIAEKGELIRSAARSFVVLSEVGRKDPHDN